MIQRISDLKKANKNNLVLHAGDALSGTLYYTLFKGKADAALMNVGHFDLFALGNHEFDDGNLVLKNFLDELKIPVVSAKEIILLIVERCSRVIVHPPFLLTELKGCQQHDDDE